MFSARSDLWEYMRSYAAHSSGDGSTLVDCLRRHRLQYLFHPELEQLDAAAHAQAVLRLDQQRRRNSVIVEELRQIISALNQSSLPFVYFKGLSLADDLYTPPETRPFSDIDILVRRRDLDCTLDLLGDLGFMRPNSVRPVDARMAHPAISPPAGNLLGHIEKWIPDLPPHPRLRLDLHIDLFLAGWNTAIDPVDDVIARRVPARLRGIPVFLLEPHDRLLHLLVHFSIHYSYEGFTAAFSGQPFYAPLQRLHDAALFLDHYGGSIDWDEVMRRAGSMQVVPELALGLRFLDRIYPGRLPSRLTDHSVARALSQPIYRRQAYLPLERAMPALLRADADALIRTELSALLHSLETASAGAESASDVCVALRPSTRVTVEETKAALCSVCAASPEDGHADQPAELVAVEQIEVGVSAFPSPGTGLAPFTEAIIRGSSLGPHDALVRATLVDCASGDQLLILRAPDGLVPSSGWPFAPCTHRPRADSGRGGMRSDQAVGETQSMPERLAAVSGTGQMPPAPQSEPEAHDGAPLLRLPAERSAPGARSRTMVRTKLPMSAATVAGLTSRSAEWHIDVSELLLSGLLALLFRYTDEPTAMVALRAPFSPSNAAHDWQRVAALPVAVSLGDDPTFSELASRVREACEGIHDSDSAPPRPSPDQRAPQRERVYQLAFEERDATLSAWSALPLEVGEIEFVSAGGDHEVVLQLTHRDQAFDAYLYYRVDLFDFEAMERVAGHLARLLDTLAHQPGLPLSQPDIVGEAERRQLLSEWNRTDVDYPEGGLLAQLVEDQVDRTPTRMAITCGEDSLTYAQLDRRANALAHYLRDLGVGPETVVGAYLERSLDLVVAILAIGKAGGAFLPLDPDNPRHRILLMLSDTGAPVVLTHHSLRPDLSDAAATIVTMDEDWPRTEDWPSTRPAPRGSIDSAAYVIYTSGSTGQPKGVVNTHRGIVNRLRWMQDAFYLTPDDHVLHKTPISFDVSAWEIFWPLMTGAQLTIAAPGGHRDPKYLADIIIQESITVLHFVPSMLRAFLNFPDSAACTSLRRVVCSGEALPFDIKEMFLDRFGAELDNLYGPTEAAIDVTFWVCEPGTHHLTVPIGRPIANTQVYVLDSQQRLAPIGVKGDLYIGGVGLARGYLGKAALTAERFVPNPLADGRSSRLYRTGDLARILPDGVIEFLGRIDDQVKIRGFRIELGEIEETLRQYPGVADAAVVCRQSGRGEPHLVAYVVPREGSEATAHADDHVRHWSMVYDRVYEDARQTEDRQFNTAGWISSYTGERLPDEDMAEWVSATVDRILRLPPRRVLEIGAGLGLLLHRIAPYCKRYIATDVSAVAVEMLEASIATLPNKNSVSVLRRNAADMNEFTREGLDTIIVNSVVQLLPRVEDVLHIIESGLRLLKSGGAIFIGDVRALELAEAFYASVHLARQPSWLPAHRLSGAIRSSMAAENELLIDSRLFLEIGRLLGDRAEVSVELKRGSHANELTNFRYDVTIRLNSGAALRPTAVIDWAGSGYSIADVVRHAHDRREDEQVIITGVPNARTAQAVRALALIRDAGPDETVAAVRERAARSMDDAVDPEALLQAAAGIPCSLRVGRFLPGQPGTFDILLSSVTSAGASSPRPPTTGEDVDLMSLAAAHPELTTHPLETQDHRNLVVNLRSMLRQTLPDYMVPAHFAVLPALPLTTSGKIDRKRLPAPEDAQLDLTATYIPPRNPTELELARIWADMLGVARVGGLDNFFDLGGDSLVAMQLVTRLHELFPVCISPAVVFQAPTLSALADYINEQLAAAMATTDLAAVLGQIEQMADAEVEFSLQQSSADHTRHGFGQ